MNVLFADDESAVREIIVNKINKKRLNIENIYQADNGVQALEMYEKYHPEIVITDIKMPKMDGLELSREIRRMSDETRIIILSGYDEFEFAQQALRNNINEYILKPAKIEKIEEAIEKAELEYSEYRKKKEKLNEKEFVDLINGRISPRVICSNSYMIVFGYQNIKDKTWNLMCDHALIRYGIINVLKEMFKDEKYVVAEDNNGCVVVLLYKNFSVREDFIRYIGELKKMIETAVSVFIKLGVSSDCISREYRECYNEAYRNLIEPSNIEKRYSPLISSAIDYIEKNIRCTLGLNEVAKFVHLSPTYFSALFKKETGKNFSGYISDVRIEMAKSLLRTKQYKVYEVADMLGFENPRYFSLFFKKHLKMTISEFQELQKGNDK